MSLSILEEICESVCERVELEKKSNPIDSSRIGKFGRRSLRKAIGDNSDFSVIGEVKGESPSAGKIRDEFNVSKIAKSIENGGAVGISVLTEPKFFGGELEYLRLARSSVDLPVLRKDFILDEYQLLKSAKVKADVVLLISRVLGEKLPEFVEMAQSLGMEALVEVDNQEQAEFAVGTGADLIGVNNRDLSSMEVDISKTEELSKFVPSDVCLISESGIGDRKDIKRVRDAGADAALVGSALMEEDNLSRKVSSLARGGVNG